MDVLIDEVVKLLGGVLAAALIAVLYKLLQRFGIALEAEKRDQLEAAARQAVARAEEWAARQIKAKVAKKVPRTEEVEDLVAGVLGLAYGGFSFTKQTHEAKVGPLSLSVKEQQNVNIPAWLGVGSILLGGALLLYGGKRS